MIASEPRHMTVDGNQAAASVAYRMNEVIAIYPITPASPMGEHCDEWAARAEPNLWGDVPQVIEMQSEAGAAGTVHGALQAGALTTTFTASQGLLLMLPNLYKIAGELTPFCLHVAARTIATHALSIFGDHSDVMACRQAGLALLASTSVQEAHDMACIGQMATLAARVPVLHFMDGFRTSHEVTKIAELSDDDLRELLDTETMHAHRERALTPDRPVLRGTAQNPDAFFQAREAANPYYDACSEHVQAAMDRFAARTGRHYRRFEYVGHPEAERVVILMGSGADAAHAAIEREVAAGERVGLVKVRLYRPFDRAAFLAALPPTTRAIAALDRTKEPGALGEPLYQDVVTALHEGRHDGGAPDAHVIGGRYGLSSKEFTPAMVLAILAELGDERPRQHFTVGIVDDVSRLSIGVDEETWHEPDDVVRAIFFGLGSDGTVGATKNSVKIIAADDGRWAQGYFEYDSKKAGAMTVSHLRFGDRPLRSPYRIREASFVACHQFPFLDQIDVLEHAAAGGTLLLNAPYPADRLWDHLPREVQDGIIARGLSVYTIDATAVARECGIAARINTIMQACFFALSGVLERDEAIERIRESIRTTYGKKSSEIVRRNLRAIDQTLAALHQVEVPDTATSERHMPPTVPVEAPEFVQRITALLMTRKGDALPVSAFPVDGTWPVGTARWEKRNLAHELPVWDADLCIQCNKCALVCPHAAIRAKLYEPKHAEKAPATFKSTAWNDRDQPGLSYTIQVAPEDCTGCALCIEVCPAKDRSNPRHKALDPHPQAPLVEEERRNYDFFLDLPSLARADIKLDLKGSQLLEPLFEASGACVGCGETPYVKLLSQLFGDRTMIANATGCSSIYGGNLPTTPYTTDGAGRGPAWSNSLFEDNAEFGLGMRLGVDTLTARARTLVDSLGSALGDELTATLLGADPDDEAGLAERRRQIEILRRRLEDDPSTAARELTAIADYLVRKSVWIVGGDGWAYDIGFGGVDHILATGHDVNMLVLDTEVYSNTGGQQSKATPLGATAKFATAGKETSKKDLGLIAMTYGDVYVARIAFGAKDAQTVRAFREAESYPGTSMILALSPCIAHGYDLRHGLTQQKLAVDSGHWPLFRFDPRLRSSGKSPLTLDSGAPRVKLADYARNEMRYRLVERNDPERFKRLLDRAQEEAHARRALYEQLRVLTTPTGESAPKR